MSKKATDTAAETLSAAELKALLEKLEAAETRAADAEQARADAESRAVASETALEEARSAAAAPAAYADYAELPAVVAAPQGLNLRNGPAVGYGPLEILPDGANVTVLPLPYGVAVSGWALVVSNSGTIGWVMTDFLSEPPGED
ncbi:SH3 domain-containing protein [uncultured Oscillibacter sp.]|uniref:SH3 domain-containing protein n=1 Tax=uncultured Oscillibacter sp. TaxID=876091 RepID=UPI0025E24310|nr:SH3 domain-containing protein [uncultured Oscillibacter sp.]